VRAEHRAVRFCVYVVELHQIDCLWRCDFIRQYEETMMPKDDREEGAQSTLSSETIALSESSESSPQGQGADAMPKPDPSHGSVTKESSGTDR
jgi:hypothetical protein